MRSLPFAAMIFVVMIVWITTSAQAATPWEDYLDCPTPARASRVKVMTYTPGSDSQGLSDDEVQILQNQVLARDREAFRLAVRLYRAADGGDAEDLGALLGRTARSQPEFFLRELAAAHIRCSDLSWALNATGLEYVDRPEAKAYEIAQRKNAIRSVRAKKLQHVRTECLQAFR